MKAKLLKSILAEGEAISPRIRSPPVFIAGLFRESRMPKMIKNNSKKSLIQLQRMSVGPFLLLKFLRRKSHH
jgi:hypothetical protein